MPHLDRRRFLVAVAAAGLAPRLVHAGAGDDGFIVLEAAPAEAPLLGKTGKPTPVWAFGGTVPGPILRVRQGAELKVRLVNRLAEPTMIHWHGIRIANAMDGTPLTQKPVEPGQTFDYVFTPPDAGTFWYHPHIRAAEQVERGLYGLLIVEEADSGANWHDIPMVLDDWWLSDDGAVRGDTFGNLMVAAHGGRIGNWFTVDGRSRPVFQAPADRPVRLRLANTANALVMNLLIKGIPATILAIDGQPVAPRPLEVEPLVLAPGGRVDIALPAGSDRLTLAVDMRGEPLEIAYVERTGEASAAAGDIMALPANPLPRDLDLTGALLVDLPMEGGAMGGMAGARVGTQDLTMRQLVERGLVWSLAGYAGMPENPVFSAAHGRTVIIVMANRSAWPHAMHVHGYHVRLLDAAGTAPADDAWRDTVLVAPEAEARIAFVADNPGKWMLHCHMLEHQEAGMMTWFEVGAAA
jgi:FtsP/CotA-like multicopper oxidase with cupredoxin domain